MHTSFDLLAIFIIILTQRHMGREFLTAAGRRFSPPTVSLLRRCMVLFYLLMSAAFLLGFSFLVSRFELPAAPSLVAGGIAQAWLFTSTGAWLVYCAFRFATKPWRRPPFNPARRRLLTVTGATLVAAPFALVGYGMFVERLDFHVREVDIPLPNLPDGLDGLRLVQLSDIHLSAFLSEKELARVIDSANELRADLALVTGDLITAAGDPLDACLRQVARLRADAGILGCLGNHEDYARAEDYTERQGARLGIQFLRSRARSLTFGGASLHVAGVDYQRSGPHYLRGAERMVAPGEVNILLSHNPDVFPVAAEKGYALTVSGHTHGGQVTVEILHQPINPARFVTPFVYGLYRRGSACAYVTRGIGTIGVPARIGAPPEIALLRLRKV